MNRLSNVAFSQCCQSGKKKQGYSKMATPIVTMVVAKKGPQRPNKHYFFFALPAVFILLVYNRKCVAGT